MQAEKKTLESHFQKQDKASSVSNAVVFQNKANIFLVASSAKFVYTVINSKTTGLNSYLLQSSLITVL